MGAVDQALGRRNAAAQAAWEAHPKVVAFKEAVEANAWCNGLSFDVAGFNASFAFANAWLAEHGPLPASGVVSGG